MQFKPVLFKSRTFRKASSLISDIITSTSYILGLFWDPPPRPRQKFPFPVFETGNLKCLVLFVCFTLRMTITHWSNRQVLSTTVLFRNTPDQAYLNDRIPPSCA